MFDGSVAFTTKKVLRISKISNEILKQNGKLGGILNALKKIRRARWKNMEGMKKTQRPRWEKEREIQKIEMKNIAKNVDNERKRTRR